MTVRDKKSHNQFRITDKVIALGNVAVIVKIIPFHFDSGIIHDVLDQQAESKTL